MANELLNALSYEFREVLAPGIRDVTMRNDPIFENFVQGRTRTKYNDTNGLYEITTTVVTSVAGGVTFSSVLGNQTLAGTDRTVVNESFPAFPGVQDSAMPGFLRYKVSLTGMRGNLHMPLGILQANQLSAAITDYPALYIKKHIEMLGHLHACSWYADTSGRLVKINVNATSGNVVRSTTNTHVVTLSCTSGQLLDDGRARRIKPGMYVDVWNSGVTTCYNPSGFVLVIGALNYQNRTYVSASAPASTLKLYFSNTAELTAWAGPSNGEVATYVDDCWLVPRDAILDKTTTGLGLSVMPCGYQHWVLSTGTLYGAFGDTTIANLPELGSIVDSSVGDITETVLNAYLSLYQDALDGDADTIITTNGVITNILSQPVSNNLMTYERQGQALDVRMGWRKLRYMYDGKEFLVLPSPYMTKGHLLITKTGGGNLQEHLPPRIPGTGKQGGYDPSVQWLGPMFGDGIWMPTHNGGRIAEGAQAPYLITMQRTADDPRSLLLKDCTETSVY